MPRHTQLYLFAAIAAAAAGLAFLLVPRSREPSVVAYTATIGPAERLLAVNGRIRPRLQVEIRASLGGRLEMLPFDVGDQVEQGAIVARIDDAPESAAIDEARAAVEEQQLTQAQAQRDLARFEALGEFATKREVEQRRLAVEEGERQLSRRRANLKQVSELRDRRVLRAPFAGVILERPVDPGQTVSAESVIYRLADLSNPEVTAEVDETYAAEIRPDMEALVSLPGRPDTLSAKVLHIEPRVDPATGARNIRLAVEGGPLNPPAGLTVTINFLVERRAQAISIPRAAIIYAGDKASVWIAGANGIVRERAITFIDWPAERVIVTSGIEAGERILTNPGTTKPGEKVRIAN